jgi:hypothetical protein
MNQDDWEKLSNFTMFKIWTTNKKLDKLLSNSDFVIIIILIIVIMIVFWSIIN